MASNNKFVDCKTCIHYKVCSYTKQKEDIRKTIEEFTKQIPPFFIVSLDCDYHIEIEIESEVK